MELNQNRAIILSAGKQERFGGKKSKMMANINNRAAFEFTMMSILKLIYEENITIVSSYLFEDFNSFIKTAYPQTTIVYDTSPGRGTLFSLKKALPLSTKRTFISESDIYYDSDLIYGLLSLQENGIAITDKTDVAPTHRKVSLNPFIIECYEKNHNTHAKYRNIGAYILDIKCQNFLLESPHHNMIDFFQAIAQDSKCKVEPFLYDGLYLHMAYPNDVVKWENALK